MYQQSGDEVRGSGTRERVTGSTCNQGCCTLGVLEVRTIDAIYGERQQYTNISKSMMQPKGNPCQAGTLALHTQPFSTTCGRHHGHDGKQESHILMALLPANSKGKMKRNQESRVWLQCRQQIEAETSQHSCCTLSWCVVSTLQDPTCFISCTRQ